MTCFDCGQRVGVHPAVYQNGTVLKVCQLCWNKWQPFMHQPECLCEHCEWCAIQLP